ncbi:MAG: MBL fold metallo-hydrolase [Dehalococcoidia bacterium]
MATPIRVGNVEILPLLDCKLLMNPRHFFPDYAEQFLSEYAHLITDPRGLFEVAITCYLLRSEGKNVLVDTGLGNRRRQGFPPGHLDDALRDAGVEPGEIDLIVNTHLHIDHTGWNTVDDEAGNPRFFFPKARWLVQRVEWEYWTQPRFIEDPSHPHLRPTVLPLESSGRLDFAYSEQAIDANLTFVPAAGHTPGHVGIGIYSAGERAIIVGDASHHPVQLDHPDWSPGVDADPMMSTRSRERLFNEAVASGSLFLAGHWPHPGSGRIVRLEGKRVFQAS